MYIYDQQAWDDVEHTKLNKEATELLWRIGRTKELASNPVEREDAHYRSMLEPTFKPQPKFTNELTSENATAAQNEIPDTLGVCYPDPLYTLDDNIIPESMRGKDGDPNNIAIKRNLIVIHAEKDIHGHITYKKYQKEADGLFEKEKFDWNNGEDWSLKDANTLGSSRGEEKELILNDYVFVGDIEVINEIKDEPTVKGLTDPLNKNKTILHEIQHIITTQKLSEIFNGKGKNPHVSIKDYYRLCYYNEIASVLAPMWNELKNPDKEIAPDHQGFYDKCCDLTFKDNTGKDVTVDLSTKEGRQAAKDTLQNTPQAKLALLKALMEHWNQTKANLYAQTSGENAQFYNFVHDYAKSHPWGSNVNDGSNDFKEATGSIFSSILDDDFGFDGSDKEMPDPVQAHKGYFSVGEEENYLDKFTREADEERALRAKYGYTEDFERTYLKSPTTTTCETKPFEYSPFVISETELNNEEIDFYKQFFQEVCTKNNNNKDREYDLEYEDGDDTRIFSARLVRKNKDTHEIENTTHISIDGNKNVVMNATKPDGTRVVPDQARFNDLAELAALKGNNLIKFGNIKTPEYAARLYLACISHKPEPVNMEGAPDFNNAEFRNALDKETLKKIEALLPEDKKPWNAKPKTGEFEPKLPKEATLDVNYDTAQKYTQEGRSNYNNGASSRTLALLYQQRSLINTNMAFVCGVYHYNTHFAELNSEMAQQSGSTLVTDVIALIQDEKNRISIQQAETIRQAVMKNKELGNKFKCLMFPIGCYDGVPHNVLLVLDADPKNPNKYTPYIIDQLGNKNSYKNSKSALEAYLPIIARDTAVEIEPVKYNQQALSPCRMDCATVTSYLVEQLSDPNKSPEDFLNTTISTDAIDDRHVADQQIIKKAIEKYDASRESSTAEREVYTPSQTSETDSKLRIKEARVRMSEIRNDGSTDDYKNFIKEYNKSHSIDNNSNTKNQTRFYSRTAKSLSGL